MRTTEKQIWPFVGSRHVKIKVKLPSPQWNDGSIYPYVIRGFDSRSTEPYVIRGFVPMYPVKEIPKTATMKRSDDFDRGVLLLGAALILIVLMMGVN